MFQRASSAALPWIAGTFLFSLSLDAAGQISALLHIEVLPPDPVAENSGSVDMVLRRSGSTRWPVNIVLTTRDGSAQAGTDYEAFSEEVSFVRGEQEKRVSLGTGGSGRDRVHYRIAVGDAVGPLDIEARLLYQSVRPAFVGALGGHGPHVERFKALAADRPPTVEELATASQRVY